MNVPKPININGYKKERKREKKKKKGSHLISWARMTCI